MTNISAESLSKEPVALAELAAESSSLYGFFARVFGQEVSEELLGLIRSPQFLEAFFDAGGKIDLEYLRRPENELREELAAEFAALFLGPGGHISPHESVQKEGGSGHLWGPETSEIVGLIEDAGLEIVANFTGLPDHISVELELMGETSKKEAEAWQKGDFETAAKYLVVEDNFMKIHLAEWAIGFCQKVYEQTEHPFYGGLAKLAAEFLEAEKQDIPRRLKLAREITIN